ncbi:MAG TPA: cupin domain-containing protein [Mobilitalea sp.]|nr:cupin domain-containing protein [Mobilitalea sp.]
MVIYNQEVEAKSCEPGVKRKILCYTEKMMMCEVSFEKGAEGYLHSHPHLQTTYVAKGSFAFTIDGETFYVKAGDSLLMPANCIHGTKALEDGVLVDVFHPMREDFIK